MWISEKEAGHVANQTSPSILQTFSRGDTGFGSIWQCTSDAWPFHPTGKRPYIRWLIISCNIVSQKVHSGKMKRTACKRFASQRCCVFNIFEFSNWREQNFFRQLESSLQATCILSGFLFLDEKVKLCQEKGPRPKYLSITQGRQRY